MVGVAVAGNQSIVAVGVDIWVGVEVNSRKAEGVSCEVQAISRIAIPIIEAQVCIVELFIHTKILRISLFHVSGILNTGKY